MVESVKFLYDEKIIIITLEGEEPKEYTESMKDQYLLDFPDRAEDVIAIGW